MSEQGRGLRVPPGNLSLISCGYDGIMQYRGFDRQMWGGQQAADLGFQMAACLKPNRRTLLTDDRCSAAEILRAVGRSAQMSGPNDTLIFFYSGHGRADSLVVPACYTSPSDIKWEDLSKQQLFEAISRFAGRRVALLACCQADFSPLPPNTLLVAACKNDETTLGDPLVEKLLSDLVALHEKEDPIGFMLNRFLSAYHNYPLEPISPGEQYRSVNDDFDYTREKRLGREVLPGRRRAIVRSTLTEGGAPLAIDPKCYFLPY